jgi:hypothetical protein
MRLPEERKTSVLSNSLSRRLNQYALLAGGAGVTLLALSRSAQAEVIYTPTNETVQAPGGVYSLDLNNDGITDFIFQGYGNGVTFGFIQVKGQPSNVRDAVEYWRTCRGTSSSYCAFAAALPHGAKIPENPFFRFAGLQIEAFASSAVNSYQGFWHNVNNHYLGFTFAINGQAHFGWARLNVKTQGASVTAQITGYAYETIANKPIGAGQTAAPSTESVPGSLGSLGRGAK